MVKSSNKKLICIVLGTRPEIIKLAPIIKECQKRGLNYFILHTGQHYNFEMDKIFFRDFKISGGIKNLNVGSGLHGQTTGKMLIEIEKILVKRKPNIVLVQGDTNSALAGALAAVKLGIKIGHIESGLRSYDISQPEEHNRIMVDHISDFLFAPSKTAAQNLKKEGIEKNRILITGNTIADSVLGAIQIAEKKSLILKNLGLEKNKYLLATLHRQENVDDKKKFIQILQGIKKVSDKFNLQIIFPVHPRTLKKINEFKLTEFFSRNKKFKIIKPASFFDFLILEANARMILSDSGGVVEECCILKVPCVSIRDFTDRPESIEVGASTLSGCSPDKILRSASLMEKRKRSWKNPYGNGKSAIKIIDLVTNNRLFKK
jgi:UDP-N-acetylglucosamine 2-epimerase (non-hydrolysing)